MLNTSTRPWARWRPRRRLVAAATVAAAGLALAAAAPGFAREQDHSAATSTPIKHLVVIFQENVSFDHYFGTYPYAANTDGTHFVAKPDTPSVNGLTPALLTANPNTANPQRLPTGTPLTCDSPATHLRPGPCVR